MRVPSRSELFLAAAPTVLRREPPDWRGSAHGDHAVDFGHAPGLATPECRDPRLAAVLVPVIAVPGEEARLLFTERALELRRHSGQISFPGGKIDPGETPREAALREAEEEIGLDRRHVEVLGYLDGYLSGTGFFIVPVVGRLSASPSLTLNPAEVASVFEVPLDFVLERANHVLHERVLGGRTRQFYAVPFGDHYIWGATAGILRNLSDRLSSS